MVSTALQSLRSTPALCALAQFEESEPDYSPMQHETWRHLRLVSHGLLCANAHPAYGKGIALIDMPADFAPSTSFIDDKLNSIGFGAIGVNGFIPSKAFMGLQYHGIAPMSVDVREPENIAYTPSPDRWHEGFGHTVMLADKRYREMIKRFGELGMKVRSSPEDEDYYTATRHLSSLAADPSATKEQMKEALAEWEVKNNAAHRAASDARRLAALHWFSVEFGVDRETSEYKLWGAALFSSLAEGRNFCSRKLAPFSLGTAAAQYNITIQQETLYYTTGLEQVLDVLNEFKRTMGNPDPRGLESIQKPEEKVQSFPRNPMKREELNELYSRMRMIRNGNGSFEYLPAIWESLRSNHPYDALCPLGILEMLVGRGANPRLTRQIELNLPLIPNFIQGRDEQDTRDKQAGTAQAISDRLALIF